MPWRPPAWLPLLVVGLATLGSACVTQEVPVLSVKPGWGGCRGLEPPADGVQFPGPTVKLSPGQATRHCLVTQLPDGNDLDVVKMERAFASAARSVDVYRSSQELGPCTEDKAADDCDCIRRQLNPQLADPSLLVTFQGGRTSWSTPRIPLPSGETREVAFHLRSDQWLLIEVAFDNQDLAKSLEQATCLNFHAARGPDPLPVATLFDEVRGSEISSLVPEIVRYCEFPEELSVVSMAGFASLQDSEGIEGQEEVEAWPYDAETGTVGDPLEPIYRNLDAAEPHWLATDSSLDDITWAQPKLIRGLKLVARLRGTLTHHSRPLERLGTHLVFVQPPAGSPINPRCVCYNAGARPMKTGTTSGENPPCPPLP